MAPSPDGKLFAYLVDKFQLANCNAVHLGGFLVRKERVEMCLKNTVFIAGVHHQDITPFLFRFTHHYRFFGKPAIADPNDICLNGIVKSRPVAIRIMTLGDYEPLTGHILIFVSQRGRLIIRARNMGMSFELSRTICNACRYRQYAPAFSSLLEVIQRIDLSDSRNLISACPY